MDQITLLLEDDQDCSLTKRVTISRELLCESSLYFTALLSGFFRESTQNDISMKTNLEEFDILLQFLKDDTIINSSNLIQLYKASRFFMVARAEEACQTWLSKCVENEDIHNELVLCDLIQIWVYGSDNDIKWMSSLCQSHIARNFTCASSHEDFIHLPSKLLLSCIRDPDLAVESEMYLSEVIRTWFRHNDDQVTELFEEVRACNLPVHYIMANLKTFSVAARKLNLSPYSDKKKAFESDPTTLIRLSRYSQRIDIQGSMISTNTFSKSLRDVVNGAWGRIREIDISNSPKLALLPTLNDIQRYFPNLTKIIMRYYIELDPLDVCQILFKCPFLEVLDMSMDLNPRKYGSQTSSLYTYPSLREYTNIDNHLTPRTSRLKELILEGRIDLTDDSFIQIGEYLGVLTDLNIEGCFNISDMGIATVFKKCKNLKSIVASGTCLGEEGAVVLGERALTTLAVGRCGGITEASLEKLLTHGKTIQTLNVSETRLTDKALKVFLGRDLVSLDISGTKVSQDIVFPILERNPRLEKLKIYWGFPTYCLDLVSHSFKYLKSISIGLGAIWPSDGISKLTLKCPHLESLELKFQCILHKKHENAMRRLKFLRTLSLSYCNDNLISEQILSLCPFLLKLKLERVSKSLDNMLLRKLSENCPYLSDIHLVGCHSLNIDSMKVLTTGWPAMAHLHLEDCGSVTSEGVSTLFDCKALEKVHLVHNGRGILKDFVLVSTLQLPLLRRLTVDQCDFVDGIDLDAVENPSPYTGIRRGWLMILVVVGCNLNDHIIRTCTDRQTETWAWSSEGVTKWICEGVL